MGTLEGPYQGYCSHCMAISHIAVHRLRRSQVHLIELSGPFWSNRARDHHIPPSWFWGRGRANNARLLENNQISMTDEFLSEAIGPDVEGFEVCLNVFAVN